MTAQDNINLASSNKWKVNFSNFPNMINYSDIRSLYETFLARISIPSYRLDFSPSSFKNTVILHPISKANDNLETLSMTFRLDEKFLNYFNAQRYIQKVRYGVGLTEEFLYHNTIKKMTFLLTNNENIDEKILEFKELFIEELGDLDLEAGNPDAPTFTIGFRYREVGFSDSV